MPTLQRMVPRGADREQIAGEEHHAEQQHAFVQKGGKPAQHRRRQGVNGRSGHFEETDPAACSDFGSRVLGSTSAGSAITLD